MLARFLHIGKVDNYENHRSKPYQEATSGVGVHSVLRPQTVYAETKPDNIVQIAGNVFKADIGKTVVLGTQSQPMGQSVSRTGSRRPPEQTRAGSQANNGFFRRGIRKAGYRKGQAQCHESQGEMAAGNRQGGVSRHVQSFFISLGARFGRIRKTTKGTPSPQLYAYKKEKLQELEQQYREGLIDLYFGDGSFTCTEGYVPYGWQFPGEYITIPSDRGARLNIWGMIDYDSRYHGFCTTESMTSERIADFLDRFSLTIRKDTFVVLDNAKVHRSKYMKEMRKIWEKRGLYLFFLPPYSPHLNIAETLWRMLKGQWIQPADYVSTDNLFYAVNRGVAGLGKTHFINFSKRA